MSYSDVKIFTETMRMVQYPKVISIHSFRKPDFTFISDLLRWLVHRVDPEIDIHHSIDTENDRVLFITGIVKGFYQSTKMKLNPKRLYAADGHAVKELLKLATYLHQLVSTMDDHNKTSSTITSSSYLKYSNASSMDLVNVQEMKELRKLASELTEKSAKLHELLQGNIHFNSNEREEAFKFLDSVSTGFDDSSEFQHIESILMQHLQMKKTEATNIERECKDLESDRRDLVEEIKKKTIDLERNNKRLESIEKARPAFMGEYDALEEELQKHYDLFMERYRNIHYLRKEMEKFQREDEESLKRVGWTKMKIKSQMKNEELEVLRGGFAKDGSSKNEHERDEDKSYEAKDDDSAIIIEGDDENIHKDEIFVKGDGDDNDDPTFNDENSLGLLSEEGTSSRDAGRSISSKKSSSFSTSISDGSEELASSNEVERSSNSIDSDDFF